jgi:hypothetical protein
MDVLTLTGSEATRAEYDRFGGIGISIGQAIRIPSKGHCYLSTLIHVLLLHANDLRFGARRASSAPT